jgi:hypothetical protein
MYIVISKPKRMSLAAGFSHFIVFLLCVLPARRGVMVLQRIYSNNFIVLRVIGLRYREFRE